MPSVPAARPTQASPRRIGLIAGWGRYPIIVAESLRAAGHEVYCCGIAGHADPELGKVCTRFRVFGMAKIGSLLRFLKRNEVTQATMAGKIFKTLLLQKFQILKLVPDWTSLRCFYPILFGGRHDRADDTLLMMVTQLFASAGIQFRPATDFSPELLVKEGTLTTRSPSRVDELDIRFGWRLAREMGRLDIGQSVAVKGRAVLAVEAIEGTDACIERAGQLCRGGFVVVKVAKPQQDMRFDVPTIGLSTIETMARCGGQILAIEADRTILLDQAEVVRRANQLKISIVALPDEFFTAKSVA